MSRLFAKLITIKYVMSAFVEAQILKQYHDNGELRPSSKDCAEIVLTLSCIEMFNVYFAANELNLSWTSLLMNIGYSPACKWSIRLCHGPQGDSVINRLPNFRPKETVTHSLSFGGGLSLFLFTSSLDHQPCCQSLLLPNFFVVDVCHVGLRMSRTYPEHFPFVAGN